MTVEKLLGLILLGNNARFGFCSAALFAAFVANFSAATPQINMAAFCCSTSG
jgi:hypothetical protein